jgi:hypothetical protein
MTHSTEVADFRYHVDGTIVQLPVQAARALEQEEVDLDIDQQQQDGTQEPIEVVAEGNKFVRLEPNWRNTLRYFANAFVWQNFEPGKYDPVVSFIEQVRYLALKDPDVLEAVLELRQQASFQ